MKPRFIRGSYDTNFIDLPKDLQKQATQAHAELAQDRVTPRGNTIKKLKGCDQNIATKASRLWGLAVTAK